MTILPLHSSPISISITQICNIYFNIIIKIYKSFLQIGPFQDLSHSKFATKFLIFCGHYVMRPVHTANTK